MLRDTVRAASILTAVVWLGGPSTALAADAAREQRVVARAARLAALPPALRVVLIEPELAPDPSLLAELDAFVVRSPDGRLRPVIYLNRRADVVRRAAGGSAFHLSVLAAIIHHEAQHLAGASEAEARRAELAFFRGLVARGEVGADLGARYLQLLVAQANASPVSRSHARD